MLPLALIGGLGAGELLVIGVIALLIFGSRLPEVGRSLGRGLMEFKKGVSGIKDELDDVNVEADRRIDEELERRSLAESTGAADPQSDLDDDDDMTFEPDPDEADPEDAPSVEEGDRDSEQKLDAPEDSSDADSSEVPEDRREPVE